MQCQSQPLISVIITTYNRAHMVGHAIESALSQTHENTEIIVVDDGSTDGTEELIKSLNSPKIEYMWTQNWGGPARPRNIAMKNAKGNFIAFLDADDYWTKNKLEVQLRHFDSPEIVGVGTAIIKFGNLELHKQKKIKHDIILDFSGLLFKQTAALSTLLIKNMGFTFDERDAFKFVEDFDFQLETLLKTGKKIKILAEPLVYYRIHEGNNIGEIQNGKHYFAVLEKHRKHIAADEFRRLCARQYINIGIKALRIMAPEASYYFRKAAQYQKGIIRTLSLFLLSYTNKLPALITNAGLILYYRARQYF